MEKELSLHIRVNNLMISEGFDPERWRALKQAEQFSYFVNEFLPQTSEPTENIKLFVEGGHNVYNFAMLMWARKNPKTKEAKDIEQKVKNLPTNKKTTLKKVKNERK
jgi:hypothetical protein